MRIANTPPLETERLLLRKFEEPDIEALYQLLKAEEVNTFLPWFPVKNREEARAFYKERFASQYEKDRAYCYAICLRNEDSPIGYIHAAMDDSHDFGYALRKEFWHKGIVTEAGQAVIERLKRDGVPYITATHDVHNPRSGGVMRRLGMTYRYSYVEPWQPKAIRVTFRLYQLDLVGVQAVYQKYWELYPVHFIETGL